MTIAIVPLLAAAGCGVLIGLLVYNTEKRGQVELSLMAFLALAATVGLATSVLSAQPGTVWLQRVAVYGWALSLVSLYVLTLAHGNWVWRRALTGGFAGWLLLLILLDLLAGDVQVLSEAVEGLFHYPRPGLPGVVFLLSWLALAIGLIGLALYGSARARLPLHANRLLYWAAALALVFVGQLLFSLQNPWLSSLGAVFELLGASGLLYGLLSHRLFDVRGSARLALGFVLSTILTAVVIIVAGLVAPGLVDQASGVGYVSALIGLAILLAAVYQVVNQWADRFITRVIINQGYDPAVIVETYARAIGHILDVETLCTVAVGTISEYLEIRRGGMLLVTEEGQKVVVQPVRGMASMPDTAMTFSRGDPFISHFVSRRQPLQQYDIDVLPEYRGLSQAQRQWLASLQIDVYVPVMSEGLPIGFLAIGPKGSGEPFRAEELQLLQTLAGQTVVALTNARLFGDMRKLNVEIQLLNEDLRQSNERLQHMDQVKSDFITIASHELRTPLTQIKGYADILDAMIEEGDVTPGESRRLIGHISRATDQLEGVIGAMLDVSQIDIDAMSLNLAEIKLDAVLRIAVEPLAQVMRERRLTLTVRGFRNLPSIHADFQRLVQAISNLTYNAVKYTPDGGQITITAKVHKDEREIDREVELVFADTGVGIDPRDHELIFEKFFRAADTQLHSTGSTKFMGAGPGLGLSIVRGIVEAHGGDIRVESEGHDPVRCPGSAFYVTLPLRPPQLADERAPITLADLSFL